MTAAVADTCTLTCLTLHSHPLHPCRSDLLELGGLAPVASKLRTAQRMARSYSIFQQF